MGHSISTPIQPAPVSSAPLAPQRLQATAWLQRHFVADATTHTTVTTLWQTYRHTFPGVSRLGHAEFVPCVLSSFTGSESSYLLDGTYVVKGIRQKVVSSAEEASAQDRGRDTTRINCITEARQTEHTSSSAQPTDPASDSLLAMSEPSRIKAWLQDYCLLDSSSGVLLVPLYSAYWQRFMTGNCLRAAAIPRLHAVDISTFCVKPDAKWLWRLAHERPEAEEFQPEIGVIAAA